MTSRYHQCCTARQPCLYELLVARWSPPALLNSCTRQTMIRGRKEEPSLLPHHVHLHYPRPPRGLPRCSLGAMAKVRHLCRSEEERGGGRQISRVLLADKALVRSPSQATARYTPDQQMPPFPPPLPARLISNSLYDTSRVPEHAAMAHQQATHWSDMGAQRCRASSAAVHGAGRGHHRW